MVFHGVFAKLVHNNPLLASELAHPIRHELDHFPLYLRISVVEIWMEPVSKVVILVGKFSLNELRVRTSTVDILRLPRGDPHFRPTVSPPSLQYSERRSGRFVQQVRSESVPAYLFNN